MMFRRALGLSLTALLGGCFLGPVPLEGLQCPCAEPYVCDEPTGTCVAELSTYCGRPSATISDLSLTRFELWWLTAQQARLRWEVSDPTSVATLEIDLAPSADELATPGSFTTIGGTINPELARPFLPGTSGLDAVNSTILRTLEPDTAYVARLVVTDVAGRITCSRPVPLRTNIAPRMSAPIFEDELLDGATLRVACSTVGDGADAEAGMHYVAHRFRCEEQEVGGMLVAESVCTEPTMPAVECWENVGVSGVSPDLRSLSRGDFAAAYVEVSIAADDVHDAFWAEVAIGVGADLYETSQVTIVTDGAYHRYEIPLAALRLRCPDGSTGCVSGTALDFTALAAGLSSFRAGMSLSNGATLRLDSIRVRW